MTSSKVGIGTAVGKRWVARGLATAWRALRSLRPSVARPIDRKVLAALISPLLVLLVAVLALGGVQGVRETQDWVTNTRDVIDILLRTQLSLVDAETEQRAFLITDDSRYLNAYQTAASQVLVYLGQLDRLVADHPTQTVRVEEVRRRCHAKLAQLAETVDLVKREGVAAANAFLRSGHGREQMEEVRVAIGAMVADERAFLIGRQESRDREIRYTLWVIAIGCLVAMLIGIGLNFGIRHDVTLQRRYQALLEEQAGKLEAQHRRLEQSEHALALQLEAERRLSDRLAAATAVAEKALAERNAASAALERSNRELNQFAYVASHDLKAPLRGIANLAQWLEEDLGPELQPSSRDHIRVLLSRVERMDSLIDGILAYARAGHGERQHEEIDVDDLVQGVLELLAPPAGAFQVEMQESLPTVTATRAPFQQIWMNLLGNVFKHAQREGAAVRIGALDQGAAWEFSVGDNGPGIEPQYHERVFGIFQTLVSRDKKEGTGIGLATVRKLVEAEGGRVRLESQAGGGATFYFTWPKVPATPIATL